MNLGQIGSAELVHRSTDIEIHFIGLLSTMSCLWERCFRYDSISIECGYRILDLGITLRDAALIKVVQGERLAQRE